MPSVLLPNRAQTTKRGKAERKNKKGDKKKKKKSKIEKGTKRRKTKNGEDENGDEGRLNGEASYSLLQVGEAISNKR